MRLFLFFCICLPIVSCNLINPDEQIPSYLHIDEFDLVTSIGQGTDSEAISELWVYSDADIVGVYDTPAEIPILADGTARISVFAGIKNNGMSTTRIRYPFYNVYDTTLNMEPNSSQVITPRFTYAAAAVIDDSRNFETGNVFAAGPGNQGEVELINDNLIALDGNKCLRTSLMANESYLLFIDNSNIVMEAGNTVFLEMNYSCNNTFGVGLYVVASGNSYKTPILYITPTDQGESGLPVWQKIYVDLGMIAVQYPAAEYYRLYFESTSSESTTPMIYLDNLKIVQW